LFGKSRDGCNISRLDLKGSETLAVIYGKVSKEIRSNRSIYGKSGIDRKVRMGPEGYGRFQKVSGRPGKS
jgi:hypothetical protein